MGYSRRSMLAIAAAAVAAIGLAAPAHAQKTLRAVMHSDLKILDPIWTTAYIVRNHGYMIYDTLFATDAKGEIKPQMVDKHDVSADQLTHTFTLRDGLALARRRCRSRPRTASPPSSAGPPRTRPARS